MVIESDADRAIFLNPDDFGVEAVVLSQTFNVIFDKEYVESGDIAGYDPIAWCRESDFSESYLNQTIEIDGTSYTIREYQPDGTGIAMIRLEEQ